MASKIGQGPVAKFLMTLSKDLKNCSVKIMKMNIRLMTPFLMEGASPRFLETIHTSCHTMFIHFPWRCVRFSFAIFIHVHPFSPYLAWFSLYPLEIEGLHPFRFKEQIHHKWYGIWEPSKTRERFHVVSHNRGPQHRFTSTKDHEWHFHI